MRLGIWLPLVLLALSGCECQDEQPDPAPIPPAKSELEGLRASVAQIQRGLSTPPLDVSYVLEWVAPMKAELDAAGTIHVSNAWLLESLEPAVVHFWDRNGALVGETVERITLPDDFRDRSTPRWEARFLVNAPAGAASLSVALGRSGLETERASLP